MSMNETEHSSKLTRRAFLELAGGGIGAWVLSSCWSVRPHKPLPALPTVARTDRMQEYLLDVGRLDITVGEQSVSTWVYNGGVPGPELRLTEGNRLRVMVRNHLPEETLSTGTACRSPITWTAFPMSRSGPSSQAKVS